MAAPKTGRLFFKSHGDCFIHATASFVKYWNFSLALEGLAIVKVTLASRVFISCVSPRPIPYEHVPKGMSHKKYMEIDPKFAAELGISNDTDVVLESISSIEKCLRLKIAPKNATDMDILMINIEKINYELAERIRIVSCQHFFTFPVWIKNDAVLVKVVSSDPSANWVMIMPDHTMVELCRGDGSVVESDGDSTSATTENTTVTTPDPIEAADDSPFQSPVGCLHPGFPVKARSKSSTSAFSAGSSVDAESSRDSWVIQSLWQGAQKWFNRSGIKEQLGGGGGTGSVESQGKRIEYEDNVIRTEPGLDQDERFVNYPFRSQEGQTINNKGLVNSELKSKFASASMNSRGSNLTPEPTLSPRQRGNDDKISHKRTATWHHESQFTRSPGRRNSPHRPGKMQLNPYVSTPRMDANLRVQPHPIRGLRPSVANLELLNSSESRQLWCHKHAFDVYVHPSTLPEVYHYLQKRSTLGAFLVEVIPIPQLNKYVQKNTESAIRYDGQESVDGSEARTGRPDSGLPSSLVLRLCFATKVVVDASGMIPCLSPVYPTEECGTDGGANTSEKRTESLLEVGVKAGHVLMSDLVRRQLEIKECSRVQIRHVQDSWKMSFVDDIKIVLQPLNYDKRMHYKYLLTSFRQWIKDISDVSKFGGILVNRQIISLKDTGAHIDLKTLCNELNSVKTKYHNIGIQLGIPSYKLKQLEREEDPLEASLSFWLSGNVGGVPRVWQSVVKVLRSDMVGESGLAEVISEKYCQRDEWVNCQLSVTSRKLVHDNTARVSYCLLTPSDCERKRITLVADSFANRSTANFRRHRASDSVARREEGDGVPKLPDLDSLNQQVFTALPKDFGAFTTLLKEGTSYINTVFNGPKRCGTLLLCGMSGSAGAGCGKTSLVSLLARVASSAPYHAFVRMEDCTFFRNQTTARTKKRLLSLFSEAIQNEPSLIVLEDLDHVMPHISDAQEQVGEEGNNSTNKTQVFADMLRMARHRQAHVLVLATARNRQQLNKELLTSQGKHTFDRVLEIKPPSLTDRKEIVQAILQRKKILGFKDSDLRAVASRTEGFQAGDLVTLIERAISHSELRVLCPVQLCPFDTPPRYCQRMSEESGSDVSTSLDLSTSPQKQTTSLTPFSPPGEHFISSYMDSSMSSSITQLKKLSVVSASTITPTALWSFDRMGVAPMTRVGSLSSMVLTVQDFETALEGFVPISLRGLPLHTMGSVDFGHVGGLEKVKQQLRETLLWPSKYPKLFSQCTIKQRCGVLLYGAPGTGKTFLAGAVAKEFGLNFVSVKGPELLSKYIGASEKAVRDIFTRAQSARPCILFFDEFDSLAPRRGHDNTGVTDRVVNQLLTQLDGVEALQGVYVLAASSRPDLIDPALLRPGRIDIKLFCNMPDETERYEILRTLSQDITTSIDVNLCELAQSAYTEHFTGADLKALLYNAQLNAAHALLDERKRVTTSRPASGGPRGGGGAGGRGGGDEVKVFKWGRGEEEEGGVVEQVAEVPEDIKLKFALLQSRGRRQGQRVSMSRPSTRDSTRSRPNSLSSPHLAATRDSTDSGAQDMMYPAGSSTVGSLEASIGSQRGHERGGAVDVVVITQEVLLHAVQDLRPSVSEAERAKYARIYDSFTGKAPKPSVGDIMKQMVTHA